MEHDVGMAVGWTANQRIWNCRRAAWVLRYRILIALLMQAYLRTKRIWSCLVWDYYGLGESADVRAKGGYYFPSLCSDISVFSGWSFDGPVNFFKARSCAKMRRFQKEACVLQPSIFSTLTSVITKIDPTSCYHFPIWATDYFYMSGNEKLDFHMELMLSHGPISSDISSMPQNNNNISKALTTQTI